MSHTYPLTGMLPTPPLPLENIASTAALGNPKNALRKQQDRTATMSVEDRPNTPTSPHLNGHLVYTGHYYEERIPKLFVHLSRDLLRDQDCYIYMKAMTGGQSSVVGGAVDISADVIIAEHGWVRDVEEFKKICNNHPIPQCGPDESLFEKWRDTLRYFLEKEHTGVLWTSAVGVER